jgi:hypothetical protein
MIVINVNVVILLGCIKSFMYLCKRCCKTAIIFMNLNRIYFLVIDILVILIAPHGEITFTFVILILYCAFVVDGC